MAALATSPLPCLATPVPHAGAAAPQAATQPTLDTDANVVLYRQATKLSAIAYCSTTSIEAWDCGFCGGDADLGGSGGGGVAGAVTFASGDGSLTGFAGWWRERGAAVLAFRGSEDAENWASALDFGRVRLPAWLGGASGGSVAAAQVHEGFLQDYSAVRGAARAAVEHVLTAAGSGALGEVLVVGHSLGGALALLAGVDLAINPVAESNSSGSSSSCTLPVSVYTLGQPRVGDAGFSTFVSGLAGLATAARIVNGRDAVVHMPVEAMGFRHVAGERWIVPPGDADCGAVVTCDDASNGGEDTDCANSVGAD
ncbi:hypothetical protein HK405_014482, partial [Cladochytrium tenue]